MSHIRFDFKPQVWIDRDLAWNTSVYNYDEVVLPVKKVWTPELLVTNGSVSYIRSVTTNPNLWASWGPSDPSAVSHLCSIVTTMKHSSHDLLAYSNGTLKHSVVINAEVNCEVNLFNYPFASDECPVAIQTWSSNGELCTSWILYSISFNHCLLFSL